MVDEFGAVLAANVHFVVPPWCSGFGNELASDVVLGLRSGFSTTLLIGRREGVSPSANIQMDTAVRGV
jgi:hypothetical protein